MPNSKSLRQIAHVDKARLNAQGRFNGGQFIIFVLILLAFIPQHLKAQGGITQPSVGFANPMTGADQLIGSGSSTSGTPSALSLVNCATALTYSTSSHTFGCNASVAPGGAAGGDLGSTYPNPTVLHLTHVTDGSLANSGLANPATTVNGQTCTLGSTCTVAAFGNPMTTLGDIIYENATPAPARLAGNTTATLNVLTQTGNGTISAAPVWASIATVGLCPKIGSPTANALLFDNGSGCPTESATSPLTNASGSVLVAGTSAVIGLNMSGGTLPALPSGSSIYSFGSTSRVVSGAIANTAFFSSVRWDGTVGTPTAVQAGEQIGGFNSFAYNGTALNGPNGTFRCFANENQGTSNAGTYCEIGTTTNATTTEVGRIRFEADGGVTLPNTVTGGDKGVGTLNAAGLYVNGVAVVAGGCPAVGSPTANTVMMDNGSGCPIDATSSATILGLAVNGKLYNSVGFVGSSSGASYSGTAPGAGQIILAAGILPKLFLVQNGGGQIGFSNGSQSGLEWSSTTDATGTTIQTSFSQPSAGLLSFDTSTVGNGLGSWKATAGATLTALTANLKTCTASTGTPWRAAVSDATAPAIGVALTGGGTLFALVHCSLTTGTYIVDGI